MSTVATSLRLSTFRRISWSRPEWWSLGLCFGAWLLIIYRAVNVSASHQHHVALPAPAVGLPETVIAWPEHILWWLVMVVAMMFPLLTAHVRNIAARSLWSRRHRAIGGFLAGYLAPWMIFGVAASGALLILPVQSSRLALIVSSAGLGIALIWQLMPARRRSVLACHRTRPIAPSGWRADRDCLRYGWMIGSTCVVSCWALMLACLLAGHGLLAMVGTTAIVLFERKQPRPRQVFPCTVIIVLAIVTLVA